MDLAFSFEPELDESERVSLLLQAADSVDAHKAELGKSDDVVETPEGRLLRDLANDVARFAAAPAMHELLPDRAEAVVAPEALQGMARDSRLVSVYFPLVLQPQRGWSYSRLDLGVQFNPGSPADVLRPKTVEILPAKRFEKLLEATGEIDLKLGAGAQFEAGLADIPIPGTPVPVSAGAAVDAHAAASLGMWAKPVHYKLRRAHVEHTEVGAEEVFWRLNGTEFVQDNIPAFVVLLQLPERASELRIHAAMRIYRNFTWAGAPMVEAMKSLPRALGRFLRGGAPIAVAANWDLSNQLAPETPNAE